MATKLKAIFSITFCLKDRCYGSIKRLFLFCVKPKSENQDFKRQEFILNIFVVALIFLLIGAIISSSVGHLLADEQTIENNAQPLIALFVILLFLFFLYFLSRKGFFVLASYLLLAVLLFLAGYMIYRWGIQLPTGLLSYALVVVISGILISARFAFFISLISSLSIFVIGYLQINSFLVPNFYWKNEAFKLGDIVILSLIFGVIATVSWLSNREIEKSLARARRSEAELKKERDSLEITVEARTKELKETQAEKMTQLYRFAEFGRLSSGLFHDLINPLTAVSLNIEKVKNAGETKQYVNKAIVAAKKMEDMVSAVRKQLSRQETKTLFSVNNEITQALEVLAHKAQKSGVAIHLFSREEIKTYGDAVKFNQVALNLIVNAIDAYVPAIALAKAGQKKANADSKPITMSLSKEGGMIVFEVKDKGVGISEENKPKLFEPFFTTKEEGYGLGIGLSMIKRIVEKDFGGNIEVASPAPEQARYGAGSEGEGSVFIVKFPQKQYE